MAKNTGLGRGFDSLIPKGMEVKDIAVPGETIRKIDLNKIVANPDQPRKTFDESSLKELAQSIKKHGVIQPLVLTPYKDKYRIVAGERRFRAAQIAGSQNVPAVIRNHEELEEIEIALVENVQRVDLSPLEQAVSIVRLRDQFSLTTKDIAQKLGKAETTISNIIRLLNLPKEAIEALQKNEISEGHARAILSLKTDEKEQKVLLSKIITQNLSVREAEAYAKTVKSGGKKQGNVNSKQTQNLLNRLSKNIRPLVSVKEKDDKSGSITIKYKTQKDLENILKNIDH